MSFFITKYGDIDFHRVPVLIDDKDIDKIYLTKFLLVKRVLSTLLVTKIMKKLSHYA